MVICISLFVVRKRSLSRFLKKASFLVTAIVGGFQPNYLVHRHEKAPLQGPN